MRAAMLVFPMLAVRCGDEREASQTALGKALHATSSTLDGDLFAMIDRAIRIDSVVVRGATELPLLP